jgi:lipid-A-disaccharide synthase
MIRPRELLVIAGEVSGDMHAARLIRALRRRDPSLRCYGIGGPRLRAEGVETLHDIRDMAVMGFTEVVRRLAFFRRVLFEMVEVARTRRPDAAILVDYPGFNLRYAARLHAMGIKVIYYICPQVWAWNRRRIPRMAMIVDHLLAIFPFETQVFAGTPLRVDFVGHPLIDDLEEDAAGQAAPLPGTGVPRIALLPGSRRQEIDRILPVLSAAARLLERRFPGADFLIPTPSQEGTAHVRRILDRLPRKPARVHVVEGAARAILRQSRAALVTSGTATLEAALLECPTVVVYKTSPLTYVLGRLLIRVPFIGIVNVIAGRRVCPEFIQDAATPEALAEALAPLVEDSPSRQAMQAGFAEVRAMLGKENAADLAARLVLEALDRPG